MLISIKCIVCSCVLFCFVWFCFHFLFWFWVAHICTPNERKQIGCASQETGNVSKFNQQNTHKRMMCWLATTFPPGIICMALQLRLLWSRTLYYYQSNRMANRHSDRLTDRQWHCNSKWKLIWRCCCFVYSFGIFGMRYTICVWLISIYLLIYLTLK